MTLFGGSEMAGLRALRASAFDLTCTIRATAETRDDEGGPTPGTITDVTGVPCNLSAVSSADPERLIADRLGVATPWVISLPVGQAVTPANTILIGSRAFEVKAVLSGRSYETSTRVLAEEVT